MSYVNSLATHNGMIGKIGEDFACEYLINKGHKILVRNFKNNVGEIDIASVTKDGGVKLKLHITEVKTSSSTLIRAEENMHPVKMRKVAKMAEIYRKMLVTRRTVSCETPFSVDFIGVNLNNDQSLKSITHLENLEIY